MTVRAFILLMLVTVAGIAVGDYVAEDFTSPGMARTFAVFVIAGAIVAPVAWLLGRIGWIRGRFDLGRKNGPQRDGGEA
jgi:uncharacterized membrane protein YfcA